MESKFDFLRENDYAANETHWKEEQERWLHELELFYEKLERWLKEPIEEGLISIQFTKHELIEEHLGIYIAPGMKIFTKGKHLEFIPVGRLIIGAQGRVDLFTEKGDIMLIKLEDENRWLAKEKKRNGMNEKWDEEYFLQVMEWAIS
ncbi:hypothetical protein [Bacillus sp. FSL K6-3431]|uniref:hypothetical protein n=1 Tax=Bacillus sp. FSL K6-3431 TaxID=2921500 RepID=UPI0030F72555